MSTTRFRTITIAAYRYDDAQHERVVAIKRAADEQLAQSRDAEHLLNDHRAGEHGGRRRTEIGHDRHHRGL